MNQFQRSIIRLKNDSLQDDPDRYGRPLFSALEDRGRKVIDKVIDKLDEHRPNAARIDQDERFAMKQALKRIRIDDDVRRIVDAYAANILGIRNQYYQDLMQRLAKTFDEHTPGWVKIGLRFTKTELSTVTDFVMGMDLKRHLTYIRERTIYRLNSIILDSYKEAPKRKQAYRRTYTDALRGALRGLISSLRGLTRGLFAAVYEQTQARFLAVLNYA